MKKREELIVLKSDQLEIGILKPQTAYTRFRFDWTGFISEVTLDGKYNFPVSHMDDEGKALMGRGMCNEFGMVTPIGRDVEREISNNKMFPKIGVGVLPDSMDERKDLVALSDMKAYPVTITEGDDCVTFVSEPVPYDGYAVRLKKCIRVEETTIIVDYELENTGEKSIHTEEYCHNFVRLDDYKIGPDYLLETSFEVPIDLRANALSYVMDQVDEGIRWSEVPDDVYFFRTEPGAIKEVMAEADKKNGYQWKLSHGPSGLGMIESGDFTPHMFAVWGKSNVVSPEVFIKIDLEAGETMTWQRRYTFEAK